MNTLILLAVAGGMSSAHFIYIPLILLAGIVLGFILGGRAARDAFEMERKREEARAAAKAAREARKAGSGDQPG